MALFLRENKRNQHKCNLVEYLEKQICKYARQDNRPSEQIKGMNILLSDIIMLDDKVFERRTQ